jgi:abequosyltransferase
MLEKLCPICREYSIPIIISDNCSPDNTQEIASKYCDMYHVTYFKQEENIGADKNFTFLLMNAKSKYIWLLGDSIVIDKMSIGQLIEELRKNDYDYIITGARNRTEKMPERKIYTDTNDLLSELGWHMTYVSTLIYNEKSIHDCCYNRYYDSNFLQTGIIFEHLAVVDNFQCLFYNTLKVDVLHIEKRNYWISNCLEIFCRKWYLFVMSLPMVYSYKSKTKCILEHGFKSGLFSLKGMVSLRAAKIITINKYFLYYQYIRFTIRQRWFFLFICFVPSFLLSKIIILYKCFIKKTTKEYL